MDLKPIVVWIIVLATLLIWAFGRIMSSNQTIDSLEHSTGSNKILYVASNDVVSVAWVDSEGNVSSGDRSYVKELDK